MAKRAPYRVELEKPSLRREEDSLDAVRRSRKHLRRSATSLGTPEAYRRFLGGIRKSTHEGYFVVVRETGALAVVVNLNEIVRGQLRRAYLGSYGFVLHTGQGYMGEGLHLVLRRAFGELKLHRVESNMQPQNEDSRALVR